MNMSKLILQVGIDSADKNQLNAAIAFLQTLGGDTTVIQHPATAAPVAAAPVAAAPVAAAPVAAAPVAAAPVAAAPVAAAPVAAAPVGSPTLEEVRERLSKLVQTHRDPIKDKLGQLGAQSLTKLDPAKYKEFDDFLKTLG